jgi:hypothetical protein
MITRTRCAASKFRRLRRCVTGRKTERAGSLLPFDERAPRPRRAIFDECVSPVNIAHNAAVRDCFHGLGSASRAVPF